MVITAVVTEEEAAAQHEALKLTSKQPIVPLPHADHTTGHLNLIEHGPHSKVDFGAEVYGIDLNNFTDADFAFIHDALHRHKLLVFKEQPQMLSPQQQYRLTSSFDPDETTGGFAHGVDPYLTSHNGVDIYGIPKRPAIPVQPQVHILGRGPLPANHYGFPPGFEIQGIDHEEFHLPPHIPPELREPPSPPPPSSLAEEDDHDGEASAAAAKRQGPYGRFYQWHFDGSLYAIPPPRVGCLLAVRTPHGNNNSNNSNSITTETPPSSSSSSSHPDYRPAATAATAAAAVVPNVTIRWDDGTGTEMQVPPGATAMVAGSRALALLDDATRRLVLHSRVEYAPHAFVWMAGARSARLGHVLETEGRERADVLLGVVAGGEEEEEEEPSPQDKRGSSSSSSFPKWERSKVCVYPMVWTNPVTGEKSLQVHGQGAWKLYLRDGPEGEEKVVEDLAEVRAFMHRIMRPVLNPENIYAHPHREQDVILWYNRALWHSITEFPKSYGPRIMHQCNIAASDHPSG